MHLISINIISDILMLTEDSRDFFAKSVAGWGEKQCTSKELKHTQKLQLLTPNITKFILSAYNVRYRLFGALIFWANPRNCNT
jgi:hypothetical protein